MLKGKKYVGTVAYMGGVMSVPEKFCWSWSQMIQYNDEYLVDGNERVFYTRATASYHSFARNMIVKGMRGDWLLMLDTDHAFEPDLLARMLCRMYKHDLDVVTGMYQYKYAPHSPVVYIWQDEEKQLYAPLGDWDKNVDLFPVASSGAGCLLVRRRVFDEIWKQLKEQPFDIIHPYSEDHSFFKRLHKIGVTPYCCPSIESNHLQVKEIGLKDYDKTDLSMGDRKEVGGLL